jgi:cobalt-zinc-cadmium efflux system outer membrane protein
MKQLATKLILMICFVATSLGIAQADEQPLTLEKALSQAMGTNPEIGASVARADSEHSAIRSQYWLDNPKIGLMRESNLNFMEQQMGPMTLWSVSQEVKFPAKYFLLGSAQKSRARSADEEADAKKLEVRRKAVSGYFSLFATSRIISLLEAQRETLREVARAAESRHATGAVPQQDEMKAHVEQTKIENELLLAEEERESMEAMLNAVLNQDAHQPIVLPKQELATPKLKVAFEEIPKLAHANANHVKHGESLVDEANSQKALAALSYAPDFMLSYRKAFINAPDNAYAASIEMTIPLWFFTKQTSEVSVASAKQVEAEKNLEKATRELHSEIRSLTAKVRSHEKLLQIYQTALIPQASSTLNSSRTAYQAGRTNFLELLDSERSLYETRIAYYRNLAQYVDSLARLEEMAGTSLSTLPFGDSL